jgi:hypothetical protein
VSSVCGALHVAPGALVKPTRWPLPPTPPGIASIDRVPSGAAATAGTAPAPAGPLATSAAALQVPPTGRDEYASRCCTPSAHGGELS